MRPLLYETYQGQRDVTAAVRAMAALTVQALGLLPPSVAGTRAVRYLSATNEMVARSALTHERPAFGIDHVTMDAKVVSVSEEVVMATPFASLLHFSKDAGGGQPRVLLVTALAGHFSTLLRSTVRSLLADHDVFVTDWHNARDVGIGHGPFGLDDYIDHVIRFLELIGPGAHLFAVCQPCPAALAATAIMAEQRHEATPRSLTLMAGPVDTRVNPTVVNDLATRTPLEWFADNVITTVPLRYRGALRRVYPGFLQLAGFAWMNLERHVDRQLALYDDLVNGRATSAEATKDFYDEYFAVLDLPAEFYLETIAAVFQRHLLPQGLLEWRGRRVDPGAIRKTALLTVEGERDDICGIGQTLAAQDICRHVPPARRRHHLQAGVGHYGVFSGAKWQTHIYPIVRSFVRAND